MDFFEFTADLDQDRMRAHLEKLSSFEKLSGSDDAMAAADYIIRVLENDGVDCHLERFDAFLSDPVCASVELPDCGLVFRARPRSFSADAPDGVEGILFHDPGESDIGMMRGKIVLAYGFDERYCKTIERYGAVGLIQIWTSDDPLIHEDTVSGVWGTPTSDSSLMLPSIPVAGVSLEDGLRLIELTKGGDATCRLVSEVKTGVSELVMPVAEIRGKSDDFVLLSCHYDSWFKGAVDNCSADSVALEIARVLNGHATDLERGVKIVWWSGHSDGRYAGSTWYCDNHWHELCEYCIAHVTSDLMAPKGGSVRKVYTTGIEGKFFHSSILARTDDSVGIAFGSIGRGADQSFWGADIPIHFYSRYELDGTEKRSAAPGGAWWWHTSEDTFDKVDLKLMEREASTLLLDALSLAAEPRLPFDLDVFFGGINEELSVILDGYPSELRSFEITDVFGKLRSRVQVAIENCDDATWNYVVRKVGGVVNRIRQSYGSRYDHDYAFSGKSVFSRLYGLSSKGKANVADPDRLFVSTGFLRGKNRIISEISALIRDLDVFCVMRQED